MYSDANVPPVPQGFDAFNDWFTGPFRAFGANLGTWLLQGLILIGIYFGVYLVLMLPMLLTVGLSASDGSEPPSLLFILVMIVFYAVVLGVSTYTIAGMTRTALKQLRGQPTTVGDLFSGGDVFWKVLGVTLLIGIFSTLGLLACVIPGIIIGSLLALSIPIAVDRNLGAWDSIKLSWNTCKQNWLFFSVYFLVIYLGLTIANLVTCGVGSLVYTPLMMLITSFMYVSIFDGAVTLNAVPAQQPYLPPAYTPPPAEGLVVPPSYPVPPSADTGETAAPAAQPQGDVPPAEAKENEPPQAL